MISMELSPNVEKQFTEVVDNDYDGDSQRAIATLLELHRKYGWQERFSNDIESTRAEGRRAGDISSKEIDDAVRKYRKVVANKQDPVAANSRGPSDADANADEYAENHKRFMEKIRAIEPVKRELSAVEMIREVRRNDRLSRSLSGDRAGP
uniref:Uncharacterized protein n=1 Tax=Candidatus Kentrum eta TaxID=2126337 RepID=A0A450UJG9_9GAMM|nr:MAG: hypothetical protein BECKH772A_GA0070896_1003310 [Candidatus Kentron sp. H]VFJ92681.1 MAG: hypothetical protein BECKH772B_GA0070898_1003210 [Candidatus Kentron sp. H]VFJ99478.1 MAG: hypothetical protein BECKH772C_GA0070978_1003210 [Candidatus Kentron sp. H]